MTIKEKLTDRLSLVANTFLSDLNSPDGSLNFEEIQDNQLVNQIKTSFASTSSESTDYEWFLFSKSADNFLTYACDTIASKVLKQLPKKSKSEKNMILSWFTPWRLNDCHRMVKTQMEVPTEQQHLRSLPTTDKQICDFIKYDIMNLYDQTVIERIWKADQCSDQPFFDILGKSIQTYLSNSTSRRVQNGSGFNFIVSVLCELHRIGLVNLHAKGTTLESENDWIFARECILAMKKNCPTLLKTAYIQKRGRFIQQFAPEFDVNLGGKGTLTKGDFSNRLSRFRTRQWIVGRS